MRTRIIPVLAAFALVGAVLAGLAATASAAKPGAEIAHMEIVASPVEDSCDVFAYTDVSRNSWVEQTLTVEGFEPWEVDERVFGDAFAEIRVTLEGLAGNEITVEYEAAVFSTRGSTVADVVGSIGPEVFTCTAPANEPYVDGYPVSLHGKDWDAEAVAGFWPDPEELSGVWTVGDVTTDPEPGTPDPKDPVKGPVTFRYDGIPKKTESVDFALYRGENPIPGVTEPIATVEVRK